jgi:crotonobetainyl-CoA:carnitine CoA-transferase CaiB-like acyl-CoA transferase
MEAIGGFIPPSLADDDAPPRPIPIPVHDTAMPLLATTGILAALLERERSGRGQRVELSLLGASVALNAHSLVRLDDQPPQVVAFPRAFYGVYRTADGWIAIAAYAERLAHRFCDALGLPGLLEQERFRARSDRVVHGAELRGMFAERLRREPTRHWTEVLGAAGVPCGPVRERDELFDDPQVRATGLLQEVRDEELGRVTMIAPAVRLSRTPGRIGPPGRHLGADTRAVLAEAGYGDDEIAALLADGAAVARDG